MLVTSTGIAIDMHFCKGSFKSVSVFGKAAGCVEMLTDTVVNDCINHNKETSPLLAKKKCCSNSAVFCMVDAATNQCVIVTKHLQKCTQLSYFIDRTSLSVKNTHISYGLYTKPPLIINVKDYRNLYQTFRI